MSYTNIFYTVPLVSKTMIRTSTGTKVDENSNPIKFPPTWRNFISTRNATNTPLLASIAKEDFIGIDIDCTMLFNTIIELLKDSNIYPTYIALSLPTSLNKGGHILFRYDKTTAKHLTPLVKYLKKLKIDVQMRDKLIYMATEANKTKELITPLITSLDALIPLPKELLSYLVLLALPLIETTTNSTNSTNSTNIANMASSYSLDYFGFILKEELHPSLVYRLTPRKDFPTIRDMNEIQDGEGTEWLLQVRKKLQADITVSTEMFIKAINYLNSLWNIPMSQARVDSDIHRDITSSDFKYDANYTKNSIVLTTKTYKETVEAYYIPATAEYLYYNRTTGESHRYSTFSKLQDTILTLVGKKVAKEVFLQKAIPINLKNTPLLPPYFSNAIDPDSNSTLATYNQYKPSEGTMILKDTTMIKSYNEPTTILAFMRNLIPHTNNRMRFMQYIAYKHTTYDYSPIYFVMAGVGGAGKGILVNTILKYFAGVDRLYSATTDSMQGNFNSFLDGTDWLELDEATEGSTQKENAKLVKELKRITGNETISIERKGVDQLKVRHFVTPIITTNMSAKLITDTVANDRRLVFLKCPNKMREILPLNDDITTERDIIVNIVKELPHFAYYLANVIPKLAFNDYTSNQNWKSQDYYDYIDTSMSEHDKLCNAVSERNTDKIVSILIDNDVPKKTINDLMLPLSSGEQRVLLYNTSSTTIMGRKSLEDVYSTSATLHGSIRNTLKAIKESKSIRYNSLIVKIQCITLNNIYTPYLIDTSLDIVDDVEI